MNIIYLGIDFYSHDHFEPSSKRWRIVGMKALMGTLRKEVVVEVTCWELKSHVSKALVLPTFTYGTEIWEGDLKSSHWKVFEKGMKIHMMSHIKVCSSTYRILLVEFGELPMELYALKLTMSFQQRLAHLPSSWLVKQATSLSPHLIGTRGEHMAQIDSHVEGIMRYISLETHANPTSNITFDDIKKVYLEDNHWHHHNTRSSLLTAPWTIDLPLKLDGGQLSLCLEITNYVTFALII